MSTLRRARTALVALCALFLIAAPAPAPAAGAAPQWQAVPMPIPPGGAFPTPVGLPGDLSFWAPNRGLMTVAGNNSVREGLYSWDGAGWHQLSTVCGGGANARIAWAGPTEFWVVSRPSLPRPQQPGFALCHFKDGEVVGSYSALEASADPYRELLAAACRAPDDCWFGGVGGRDGTGQRVGAFHLHWNGTELRTVYNPQGRAVSDLEVHGGELLESSLAGRAPQSNAAPDLAELEDAPRLLRRVAGESFTADPFVPKTFAAGGTEIRALDGDGQTAWAVGGGASSGPAIGTGLFAPRPPFAARLAGGAWAELAVTSPDLADELVFADVAAVPGTGSAWTVVRDGTVIFEGNDLQPSVALIGSDGTTAVETLEPDDAPFKGAAWRIACPAANDCWMATARGYLYRWTDPAAPPVYPRDEDPAFQGTITVRPNEAAEQSIPDDPPEDDSLLNAPPIELQVDDPEDELPQCTRVSALVSGVKAKAEGPSKLVVRFRLRRPARIGIVARRAGKVVARAKGRKLKPGKRSLSLRVSAKRWPTRLAFTVSGERKPRQKKCQGQASDPDAITTRAR